MNSRISILGCGRLGLPLARQLIAEGYFVKGSSTDPAKIELLAEHNISPFVIKVNDFLDCNESDAFFDSDLIIVTIPFSREFEDPTVYYRQIKSIVKCIDSSPIRAAIFTSSTSIYADISAELDEHAFLDDHNPRSKVLIDVENLFFTMKNTQATVLRLGGIWFGEESLALMLGSEKKVIKNSLAQINVIHVDDCVGVITELIENFQAGEVFNVCCDTHPLRCDFYYSLCDRFGYAYPDFDGKKISSKIVDSSKLKFFLNYSFKRADPLQF